MCASDTIKLESYSTKELKELKNEAVLNFDLHCSVALTVASYIF